MIVDDFKEWRLRLRSFLELIPGFRVVCEAADGLEAVEKAAQWLPDIVLLDIGLPLLNGYDVCRRIRERDMTRSPVIIALSGWGQEEDKRRSKEAGFNFHMVKPVEPAALERFLGGLLLTPD